MHLLVSQILNCKLIKLTSPLDQFSLLNSPQILFLVQKLSNFNRHRYILKLQLHSKLFTQENLCTWRYTNMKKLEKPKKNQSSMLIVIHIWLFTTFCGGGERDNTISSVSAGVVFSLQKNWGLWFVGNKMKSILTKIKIHFYCIIININWICRDHLQLTKWN